MQNKQLLYVEDDEILAKVTVKAFEKRKFTIAHVSSSTQAQELLKTHTFSHALLDLKVDDGLTLPLISTLKLQLPQIRIVVLTGYASVATAVQAIKLGATQYLAKPATAGDILQAFEDDDSMMTSPLPATTEDATELMSVKRLEWEHIQRVLTENNGNISETARQLKMHRRTLQRKLQKKPVAD